MKVRRVRRVKVAERIWGVVRAMVKVEAVLGGADADTVAVRAYLRVF